MGASALNPARGSTTRGSAYIFVLIMGLSLFLTLAMAATATVYAVRVSRSTQRYSNMSLLAHSGIERALLAINSQLEADRAEITGRTLERLRHTDAGGDYDAIFIEEAAAHINDKFVGKGLSYELALHDDDGAEDVYTVEVIIRGCDTRGKLAVNSLAAKTGLPTIVEVSAVLVCSGTAAIRDQRDDFVAVESDIAWRIEHLMQIR
jgi:hypothetical protein